MDFFFRKRDKWSWYFGVDGVYLDDFIDMDFEVVVLYFFKNGDFFGFVKYVSDNGVWLVN